MSVPLKDSDLPQCPKQVYELAYFTDRIQMGKKFMYYTKLWSDVLRGPRRACIEGVLPSALLSFFILWYPATRYNPDDNVKMQSRYYQHITSKREGRDPYLIYRMNAAAERKK